MLYTESVTDARPLTAPWYVMPKKPAAVPMLAELRKGLELNPDGSIESWDLAGCGLRALPELFGAVTTTGDLGLGYNQLSSLPASFGSITVGEDLYLSSNQLSSLPDSFGSITVGGDLWSGNNQLDDQVIPAHFPNVGGGIHTIELEFESDY